KILIVEDQLSIQEELRLILEGYGTIDTAGNGKIGVETFRKALVNQSPYDLVLLDVQMPEMDGQTALKEMRHVETTWFSADPFLTRKFACIIMVTSLDDPKNFMEAYLEGRCNGYITKPFDSGELLEKLRNNKLIQ
ncbi:MAG: response regulator, partial [Magnetococcales bacterium]|nr:response regulator [Magnetococcales bacterium]